MTQPVPASPSFPYLKNFRTLHLSGRFVDANGKAIAGGLVYLAINEHKAMDAVVRQTPILSQAVTDAAGRFQFTVPKATAVLQAARSNHGNLNLYMRAMAAPAVHRAATSGVSSAPSTDSANVRLDDPTVSCPPALRCPPPPTEPPAVQNALQQEQALGPVGEAEYYSAQAATWAGTLTDPFSMYPRELVSKVDQTENLELRATKAKGLLLGNRQNCVQTVSAACSYNPVAPVDAYPQEAVGLPQYTNPVGQRVVSVMPNGAAADNGPQPKDEPSYCYYSQGQADGWDTEWVPVTDMHAYWDVGVRAQYFENTTTSIGLAVRDDMDSSNTWSVSGNSSSSTGASGGWDKSNEDFWAEFAERFVTEHNYVYYDHADQCYLNGDQWTYYWSDIEDNGWNGSYGHDGSNLSWEDGEQQWEQYQQDSAPEDPDGHGGYFERDGGQGYHYGAEASAFGVALGAETDWNEQVRETWDFGSAPDTHYLFGHGNPPTTSQVVFSR